MRAGRPSGEHGTFLFGASGMQLIKCPHCGAPPAPGFTPPHGGQYTYACPYCRHSSLIGAAPAPPPPEAAPPHASFIVIHGPGFHHDASEHVAAHVARSSLSWLIWVAVVLLISLGGAGGALMRCGGHSSLLSGLVWDGSEPLHCTGNDHVTVSGVEATFNAGSAIVATGNCQVKCTDCKITAPTAIEASGNARVMIVNGTVRGTSLLADATGNARVDITGNATVFGRKSEKGNAKVSAPPQAAVVVPSAPPAPPAPAASPSPAAPAAPAAPAKKKK